MIRAMSDTLTFKRACVFTTQRLSHMSQGLAAEMQPWVQAEFFAHELGKELKFRGDYTYGDFRSQSCRSPAQ